MLRWVPGSLFEGLTDQVPDLFFQSTEVGDALAALARLFRGKGLGGAIAVKETGPAVVGAMEFGGFGFAGAVGLAAGGAGGGEAAGQQREGDLEGADRLVGRVFFCLHVPNVYIH